MQSPITGKEMILDFELRKVDYRKEEYEIHFHYYLCEGSNEKFTDTQLDEYNLQQVHDQYRESHNLPFPEEVRKTRSKYDLSALRMSEILGFGPNTYRNYEAGEVPNSSNARLIIMADDPNQFKSLVKMCNSLGDKQRKEIYTKIESLTSRRDTFFTTNIHEYMFSGSDVSEYSGYKKAELEKVSQMIIFFSQLNPPKTKLNKLLFYSDFMSFQQSGRSMSGMKYRAIERGPVPEKFETLFEYVAGKELIDVKTVYYTSDVIGRVYSQKSGVEFDETLFTEGELKIMKQVKDVFGSCSARDIVDRSHKESAWIANHSERKIISYKDYAYDITL